MPFRDAKVKDLGKLWTKLLAETDERRSEWLKAKRASANAFKNREEGNRGIRTATRNKLFSIILTLVASVVNKRIDVKVKAEEVGKEENARRQSILANWNFHVADIIEKQEDIAVNGLLHGVAVSFCSWKSDVSPVNFNGSAVVGKYSDKANKKPDEQAVGSAVRDYRPNYLSINMARLSVLDAEDYLQDPMARGLEEATWAAHRLYMKKKTAELWKRAQVFDPKVEIVHDSGALPSTDRDTIGFYEVDKHNSGPDIEYDSEEEEDREFKVIQVWQIHDFETRRVIWVVPGTDAPLRVAKYNGINPYQIFRPVHTHDEFWSYPITYQIRVLQERLNQVTESLVQYANLLGKPVVWAPKGGDKDDVRQIANAQPGDVIKLSEETLKMAKVPELAGIPDSVRDLEPLLARDISDVIGFSDVASGVLSEPATTATEASLSSGFMSVRSGHIRWKFNNWLNDVARVFVAYQQKFFTQADAVPILGSDAKNYKPANEETEFSMPLSERLDEENIAGIYDVVVNSGDMANQIRSEKQRQSIELLNILNPWMMAGILDPTYILSNVLSAHDLDPRQAFTRQVVPQGAPPSGSAGPAGRGSGAPGDGSELALSADVVNRIGGSVPTISNMLGAAQRGR